MPQKRSYSSSYPENPPEWYWVRALHDACIVGVEMFEFPFDYNKFIQEKDKYNRNLLTLKIDASSAMFDTSVREIRFFNYKILTDEISLAERKEFWWKADRLVDQGDHYTLEIDLQDLRFDHKEFTCKIKFERAEVDRK